MEKSMIEVYRDEIQLRGEQQVRARAIAVLGGLIGGLGTLAVQGRPARELNVQVVAGALLGLRQADMMQTTPVLAHLRLALAALMVGNQFPPAPMTAAVLERWVKANQFWPSVEREAARQDQALRNAVETAKATIATEAN